MHEMAFVRGVLEAALKAGKAGGASRIARIHIKMGEYSDVVPVILKEYFAIAAKGTMAEDAELVLQRIPAVMRCRDCGWQGHVQRQHICCGGCGGMGLELVSGREFFVESLEAE